MALANWFALLLHCYVNLQLYVMSQTTHPVVDTRYGKLRGTRRTNDFGLKGGELRII